MTMPIERLPCALHPTSGQLAAEGDRLCLAHRDAVRDALDDITRLAAVLTDPEALLPKRGSDLARSSSVPKSTPPTDLLLLSLTDWRTIAERPGDPDDVLGLLGHWADRVRRLTGLAARSGPRVLTTEIGVLVRMFAWLTRQAFVAEFARQVLGLRDVLLELAGEARGRVPLGRCTTPVTDEDGQVWQCYYLLQVRLGDEWVRCPRCGTSWPRLDWPDLALELQGGAR